MRIRPPGSWLLAPGSSVWLLLAAAIPVGRAAEKPAFSIGYEARHDRLRFEFHNASSFNTRELVPHHFVQTYTADNHWLIARVRFAAFGRRWETEAGLTPQRTAYGDDYDTFFNPDGNVIVSGTFGNVSLRSYLFAQRIDLLEVGGAALRVGYRYRRDRANFQFGNSFETRSRPPSQIYELLPNDERTRSSVHAVEFGLRRTFALAGRARLAAEADVAPASVALLTTILPTKYPGREIVASSHGFEVTTRLGLGLDLRGGFGLEIYGMYGRFRSYSAPAGLRRETAGIGLRLVGAK